MVEKILSKYALKEILELENNSYAIADKNQRILWYNKSFKETAHADRIKNKTISSLFPVLNPDELKNLSGNKFLVQELPHSNKALKISLLKSHKNTDGYFIRLESGEPSGKASKVTPGTQESSSLFKKNFRIFLLS